MDPTTQKGWWGRNWLWAAPVGCLLPLLLCGGGVAGIFGIINTSLRSSDAYAEALAAAQADDQVKALLGESIDPGFFVSGNISIRNGVGNTDMSIPVSGPKGSASIHAVANRGNGPWQFSVLEVIPEGDGKRIDLRAKAGP